MAQTESWESKKINEIMQAAINRFVHRLSLPEKSKFILEWCQGIDNAMLESRFEQIRIRYNKAPIIELYHSSRYDQSHIDYICRYGLAIGAYGNKGPGAYLANHGRYSWAWAGTNLPVVICDVVAADDIVKRYKSEIMSPVYDSEFRVINNSAVLPRYLLKYSVKSDECIWDEDKFGFTKPGNFDCTVCDKKSYRCDCVRFPTVDIATFFHENL